MPYGHLVAKSVQRLSQVMARRRQEPGFGLIGERKLMRAFLDLALEGRIRILKLGRHAVELLAERLELVTGVDRDSVGQIAAADSHGADP